MPSLKRLPDSRVTGGEPGQKQPCRDSTKLKQCLAVTLEGVPGSESWQPALLAELAIRPRHEARSCLARMRSSTSEAICDVFRPMGVDGQGVKDVVDKLLADTSQAQSDTSPPSDVKTLVSRFAHVSDELSCPAGCRNPVRYGHRVGDLSKYATMERETQMNSVLAYCPTCHMTFDATL
ncbi:unnamed protein product [Effrenium voratum]|nr:unnamed protein product [Effrenium voratum]